MFLTVVAVIICIYCPRVRYAIFEGDRNYVDNTLSTSKDAAGVSHLSPLYPLAWHGDPMPRRCPCTASSGSHSLCAPAALQSAPLARASTFLVLGVLFHWTVASCIANMDFESLKNQVSNLTLYDVKAGVRKVQNGKDYCCTFSYGTSC